MPSPGGGSAGHCWSTPRRWPPPTAAPSCRPSLSTRPISTPTAPDLIKPATGTGALPAGAPGVRFAGQAGYRLEQVERFSSLDMPPAADSTPWNGRPWPGRGDVRTAVTGPTAARRNTPPSSRVLMSRMSTDAPTGALSYERRPGMSPASGTSRTPGGGPATSPSWRRHGTGDSGELAAYSVLRTGTRQTVAGRPGRHPRRRGPPRAPPGHAGQDPQPPPAAGRATRPWDASSPTTPPKTTTCSPSTSRWASSPPAATGEWQRRGRRGREPGTGTAMEADKPAYAGG